MQRERFPAALMPGAFFRPLGFAAVAVLAAVLVAKSAQDPDGIALSRLLMIAACGAMGFLYFRILRAIIAQWARPRA